MLLVFIRVDLPGVLANMGIRPFISGEQGNNSLKLKGTGEQRQFWGTGNIENQDFDFGEQGKTLIFFRGTREQIPPHPPPPTHTPGRASLEAPQQGASNEYPLNYFFCGFHLDFILIWSILLYPMKL